MGSAGEIIDDPKPPQLSGNVVQSLFNIGSQRNLLFPDLALGLLYEILELYRDK
jgi:hypothetical protein